MDNALVYVARETDFATADGCDTKVSPPPRVVGVSFWMPPRAASEPESWSCYFQSLVLNVRQVLTNIRFWGRGGLIVKRYWIWKAAQEKAHRELWTDPRGYYFCNVVAIMPDQQGRGIGRRLIDVVTEHADREGIKCYLESSKYVPNVQIYEHLGFRLVRDMKCDDDGALCKVRMHCLAQTF
jgi:GNAT superfamily N-acetyltransferase